MRTIEQASKSWSYVFTCKACGSKLEADAEDVEVDGFGGNYKDYGDTGYFVSCGVCHEAHILDGEGAAKPKKTVFIPQDIKDAAYRKWKR
jgi:transcription elongation factor Elf1